MKPLRTDLAGPLPNRAIHSPESREIPVMAEMIPRGDGSWVMKPKLPDSAGETWVPTKITRKLTGQSDSTIYRLAEAGVIRSQRQTPNKWEFELGSLQEYVKSIQDPEYWRRNSKQAADKKKMRRGEE